ncbi:tail fiber assembly protein [Enterobacter kobei]|uniref:tail fiber assembly protein n=1 Tax=Enterobacter kobei TaxID=208224 RepID=UPI000DCDCA30|nr:tail fiber assembly protein [Enterobacter kobei]RAY34621.1 tail fiber assembly protein [Enterobacter kobei]
MWFWNPVDYNEALPGIHDLSGCIEIDDDQHPFKTGDLPAGKMWSNDANHHPVLIEIPPSSPEDEIAEKETIRNQLRAIADAEIVWRQDAVDAGISTEQEADELAEWKKYRVLLMRVDTTKPVWPTAPGEQAK